MENEKKNIFEFILSEWWERIEHLSSLIFISFEPREVMEDATVVKKIHIGSNIWL